MTIKERKTLAGSWPDPLERAQVTCPHERYQLLSLGCGAFRQFPKLVRYRPRSYEGTERPFIRASIVSTTLRSAQTPKLRTITG